MQSKNMTNIILLYFWVYILMWTTLTSCYMSARFAAVCGAVLLLDTLISTGRVREDYRCSFIMSAFFFFFAALTSKYLLLIYAAYITKTGGTSDFILKRSA